MSIYGDETLTYSLELICPYLMQLLSMYVCLIYAEIFEKMSSGGIEVSFSIYILKE